MNRIFKSFFAFVFLFVSFSASAASKKSIVCTTFPEYDWVMNIVGQKNSSFDVVLLQDNGTDLHSFQPSFKDIARVSSCDLFVYVGGESDVWVEKALSNATNKNMLVVNLMEALGDKVREEEIVEGMQAEEEDHDHEGEGVKGHSHGDADSEDGHVHGDSEDNGDEEEGPEYDEHVWLSLRNAVSLVDVLCENIQKLDSSNSAVYKKNAASYSDKLKKLDEEFVSAVASSKHKTLLFADRYPFRYFSDDYGLNYYAAFVGCSAESEASFETVIFLSKKIDELGLDVVLKIEKGNEKIARTVISNTQKKNQKILEMDSLQSVTKKEIKSGRSYYSAMKNNLEVLKKALN